MAEKPEKDREKIVDRKEENCWMPKRKKID
jgi:hypothetical protein